MSTFDYTIPSELMIKNYNARINKLASGRVNVIRSWKNPVGTGLQDVEFTMANRTKSIIKIMRHDISTLVPLNEAGFLVLKRSDIDAAMAASPGGTVALREKLALASGIDVNEWWGYGDVELLWVMYGVFLPPQEYTMSNAYNLPDVNEYLAQAEPYGLAPDGISLITMRPSSLGFTGQLKLVILGSNPPSKNRVRDLSTITNGMSDWTIAHALASEGMEPIVTEILEAVTKVDGFNLEGQSMYRLDELDLTTTFVDEDTGGTITVTSNDDRATGTLIINVFQSHEGIIDLAVLTNVGTPGRVELNQPDFQIYNSINDNAPRAEYLFQKWVRDTYPEYSGSTYFVKPTLVTKTGDKTIEVEFYPATTSAMGSITVAFNYNNALHLSELTSGDTPGLWEITEPGIVTNAYSWKDAMDELKEHIATTVSSASSISTIRASVFKATPQPNSDTPPGTSSAILTLSDSMPADIVFFADGQLLVTYPDVGYVPKKPVNLSSVTNINEPGVWEIESVNLKDFELKVEQQLPAILAIAFKDAGWTGTERDMFIGKEFNSCVIQGGYGNPLISGILTIYPYIK